MTQGGIRAMVICCLAGAIAFLLIWGAIGFWWTVAIYGASFACFLFLCSRATEYPDIKDMDPRQGRF